MRLSEIELWARRVVARIAAGAPREDSLVELKSKWPEPRWIARQLAAHANASRGATILWLIGVDEKRGPCGVTNADAGDWYNQLKAEFDGGVAPMMFGPVTFDCDDDTVVAVAFGTSRPPYVVRNPARDTEKSGPFSLDVPWRDGTTTRSAGRFELLQLLGEEMAVTHVEVRGVLIKARTVHRLLPDGPVGAFTRELLATSWQVDADVYLGYTGTARLVVPFHRCTTVITELPTGEQPLVFESATFETPTRYEHGRVVSRSSTIEVAASEVIINGPGAVRVICRGMEDHVYESPIAGTATMHTELHAVGAVLPIVFTATVPASPHAASEELVGKWLVRLT